MPYPAISPTVPGNDIVNPNADPESALEGNDLPLEDDSDIEDDETEEDIIEGEDDEPEDEDIPLVDATENRG